MTWEPSLRRNSAKSSRAPICGVPIVEPEDPLGRVKQATRGMDIQGHQIKAVKKTRQNRKRLKYAKGSITSDPWRTTRSKRWSKQLKATKGGQAVSKNRRILNKNKGRNNWGSPQAVKERSKHRPASQAVVLNKGKKIKRRSWSRPRPSQGGRRGLAHLGWGRGEEERPATQLGTWAAALGWGAASALLCCGALGVVGSKGAPPPVGV